MNTRVNLKCISPARVVKPKERCLRERFTGCMKFDSSNMYRSIPCTKSWNIEDETILETVGVDIKVQQWEYTDDGEIVLEAEKFNSAVVTTKYT